MRRLTTAEFVERARRVHDDAFDYTETVYIKKNAKVVIRCRTCDTSFSVRAGKHLFEGIGCPRCAGNLKKTTEQFVAEALKIHGDAYDYSKVVYTTRHGHVIIGCRTCDVEFEQIAWTHLSGSGCPRCARKIRVTVSSKEVAWLDSLQIPEQCRQTYIRSVRMNVDALVDDVVYEFYGSYYHGDPRCFPNSAWNAVTKRSMSELYERTLAREVRLKALGYEIKFVWESDYENGLSFSPRHPHECLVNTMETNRELELDVQS